MACLASAAISRHLCHRDAGKAGLAELIHRVIAVTVQWEVDKGSHLASLTAGTGLERGIDVVQGSMSKDSP